MATSHLAVWGLLLQLLLVARESDAQQQAAACNVDTDCGSNSTCSLLSGQSQCRCGISFFSLSGTNTDCMHLSDPDPRCSQYDSECVFCGLNFEGPCRRCVDVLSAGNSSCIDMCPEDIEINIIQEIRRSAIICLATESSSRLPEWALILIIAGGVFIVLAVSITAFVLLACCLQRSSRGEFDVKGSSDQDGNTDSQNGTMRTRRSNSFSFKIESSAKDADTSLITKNQVYEEEEHDEIDGDDETIFKYKLAKLRKESEVFLRMLNEMRRRLKELPPDSPVAEQYSNVIRDVTRLLYMLNKKPSRVKMPVDGVQLMRWSENILKRYVASQDKEVSLETDKVPSYMEGGSRDSKLFMEKLTYLRDNAQVFLRMLNEMRRRLKELRPDTPTAQNYRAISKDVTRLLELLNKRPSTVEMPMDGLEFVKKSERLLKRYLQSQGEEQAELQDVETEF